MDTYMVGDKNYRNHHAANARHAAFVTNRIKAWKKLGCSLETARSYAKIELRLHKACERYDEIRAARLRLGIA
jgi:hypothetical protein